MNTKLIVKVICYWLLIHLTFWFILLKPLLKWTLTYFIIGITLLLSVCSVCNQFYLFLLSCSNDAGLIAENVGEGQAVVSPKLSLIPDDRSQSSKTDDDTEDFMEIGDLVGTTFVNTNYAKTLRREMQQSSKTEEVRKNVADSSEVHLQSTSNQPKSDNENVSPDPLRPLPCEMKTDTVNKSRSSTEMNSDFDISVSLEKSALKLQEDQYDLIRAKLDKISLALAENSTKNSAENALLIAVTLGCNSEESSIPNATNSTDEFAFSSFQFWQPSIPDVLPLLSDSKYTSPPETEPEFINFMQRRHCFDFASGQAENTFPDRFGTASHTAESLSDNSSGLSSSDSAETARAALSVPVELLNSNVVSDTGELPEAKVILDIKRATAAAAVSSEC